jgi:hypothetical protein
MESITTESVDPVDAQQPSEMEDDCCIVCGEPVEDWSQHTCQDQRRFPIPDEWD